MTTTDPLEWLWTALGCLCIVATGIGWVQALGDLRIVRRYPGRGPSRIRLAQIHVRHEIERLIAQIVFVALGVLALITPAPVRASTSLFAVGVAWALMGVEIMLAASSVRDRIDRALLLRGYQQELHQARSRDRTPWIQED